METLQWEKVDKGGNFVLDNGEGKVYLSYQPNDMSGSIYSPRPELDSTNPETAIVLLKDKKVDITRYSPSFQKRYPDGLLPRFLIYRGDWREELEKLYPDIDALKDHWRKHGGYFWSDSLDV